jgi:hypothetical protein
MAPEPSAYEEILIGSLLDIRLRIRGALTLKIERESESYVAKCDELNELGYGPDPSNAVQDIRLTIAGLYWRLKEDQDQLGADLAATWQRLAALVYEA